MTRSKILTLVTAAVLGVAVAPAVSAQVAQPPAAQSAQSYSDDQLKSFAVAVLQVARLQHQFQPQLELARTPQDQQLVVMVATEAMVNAVENAGITVEEYDRLLTRAQADPALADRVRGHILNMQ